MSEIDEPAMDDDIINNYLCRLDAWYAGRVGQKYTTDVAKDVLRLALRNTLDNDRIFDSLVRAGDSGLDELIDMYKVGEFVRDHQEAFSQFYETIDEVVVEGGKYAPQGKELQKKMQQLISELWEKSPPSDVCNEDIDAAFVHVFGSYKGFNEIFDFLLESVYYAEFSHLDEESLEGMTVDEARDYGLALSECALRQPVYFINEKVFGDL